MIYLDNAATTLMKPPQVGRAILKALKTCASPGRGDHIPAKLAAETTFACREAAAQLFHVADPEKVIFTFNATHGLNIAISTLIKPGDRVVISGYEHNAVVRPLTAMGARLDVVDTNLFESDAMFAQFEKRIPGAAAVIVTHVSNVFGYILPVEEISAICNRFGVPMVVDASQSGGVLNIDFEGWGAAYVALPGHKGLLGPQGTGLLLCKDGGEPLLYGGTGSMSASAGMPDFLPDRLEAGTHNICGIAGLLEGIRFIQRRGIENIQRREKYLIQVLAEELNKTSCCTVHCSEKPNIQSGVLSVVPNKITCEAMGEFLGRRGIAVRSGLHCSPLAHNTAGTINTGTVRFSVSLFNTVDELYTVARTLQKI